MTIFIFSFNKKKVSKYARKKRHLIFDVTAAFTTHGNYSESFTHNIYCYVMFMETIKVDHSKTFYG